MESPGLLRGFSLVEKACPGVTIKVAVSEVDDEAMACVSGHR